MSSLLLNYDIRAIFGDPKILKKDLRFCVATSRWCIFLRWMTRILFPCHSSSRVCCDLGTLAATFGSTTKAVGLHSLKRLAA